MNKYVFGVDFGTDSVRSLLVNAQTGEELATSTYYYPRWKSQLYCDPAKNQFRQHPLDYLEGLTYTIRECIQEQTSQIINNIKGISIDTTGSTPVAVDSRGTPLSLIPEFADNPNAQFILWKDHTSLVEAQQINDIALHFPNNYLKYVGGIYSSEWFWAKLLYILKNDPQIRHKIASFVEHCDWIPFVLTGGNDASKIKRSVCSAGHKALWAEAFNGFPPNEFFKKIDPLLDGFTEKLFRTTYTADCSAGIISKEWAEKLGLPDDVMIGIGAFDAHVGAVGGQIEPYFLSKVMGTSTCDMMVIPESDLKDTCVRGICGQVMGSIIPGMIGLEAGQSAFGDVYAWFKHVLIFPASTILLKSSLIDKQTAKKLQLEIEENMLSELSGLAINLPINENSPLAIDWLNGRRTPDANQSLEGAITHLNLGTDAVQIFHALVEATCFGAKAIVERFRNEGIPVKGIIGLGGVAKKSAFIMQMMSDVLDMPIKIHKSEQTCALGAAMFAATAAGIYPNIEQAMLAMGQGFETEYSPNGEKTVIYQKRYLQYQKLGAFLENQP